ncbi:Uncharacterised protein [Burkholderia pseudomallei]|nr:Uncharacterised protein [Burkholderia pseudomallei]CPH56041.1 Uncharacterised protein [Burkholderia pseudomallei]
MPQSISIIQQRREQRRLRRHPAATLRQHQRRMLVTHQFRQLRMRLLHARLHARLRYPHPHRQRVDEQAQRSIRLRASLHPPEQHRAEHHVLPPRRARQHQPPRHMHHARRAHPQPARMSAKRPRQLRLQPPRRLRYLTPVSLNAQQTERRRRLIDVPQPRPEVRLVVRLAHPQPRLRDEIPERLRPRQVLRSALPDRARLLDHTLERRMIDGQVMRKQPHEPSSASRIMRGVDLHQRRPADIDAMAARIVARLELLSDVAIARIEFDDVQRQRRAALHDLDGVRQPFPEERGAQDVMPVDHLLQCRQKTIQPLARTKCEQIAFQIGIALLAQQMVEQHAFLHRYERIDILNVRRAAVHARDQRIDLALIQSNQRQLLRRDTFGVGRYPVRRHANRAAHGAMPVLDQVDQRRFVRAQQREKARVLQHLLVACDRQIVPLDGKRNALRIQQRQQIVRGHSRISFNLVVQAASSASVDVVNSAATSACKSAWRIRSIRLTVSSEWPPRSKKLSWRPTRSRSSNCSHIRASVSSMSPCGAS